MPLGDDEIDEDGNYTYPVLTAIAESRNHGACDEANMALEEITKLRAELKAFERVSIYERTQDGEYVGWVAKWGDGTECPSMAFYGRRDAY